MPRNTIDIGSNDIYKHYVDNLDSVEKQFGYVIPQKVINAAVFDFNKKLVENINSGETS